MTIGIYKLNFANTSKCYIGQSINIEVRYKQHLNLLRLGESSKKLQQAYSEYGNPLFEILLECAKEELDAIENETIEIFDSVENGFNTCITAGGKTQLCGENHPNSNYTNEQIVETFLLLTNNTDISFEEISKLTKVSKSVIAGISCLQQHQWLQDKFPEEYIKLEANYSSKIRVSTIKRGTKSDDYYLLSPENIVHHVTNARQFAKEYGLDHGHIGKLYQGIRKSHKGWKLYSAIS